MVYNKRTGVKGYVEHTSLAKAIMPDDLQSGTLYYANAGLFIKCGVLS
jgi:hypothetical protein